MVWIGQEMFSRAVSDCNKALELSPDDADAYHVRGQALRRNREFDKAYADINRAIDLRPDFAKAYLTAC
jgi:Flp pilus assembly protein TadD